MEYKHKGLPSKGLQCWASKKEKKNRVDTERDIDTWGAQGHYNLSSSFSFISTLTFRENSAVRGDVQASIHTMFACIFVLSFGQDGVVGIDKTRMKSGELGVSKT